MTDLDLERLGDMWRQQPDPAELERLHRSANIVRRRARLKQVSDVAAAVIVGGVVLFLVISSGKIEAAMAGSAAILVLLVSNVRQRRLRQVELRSLSGATEDMLDQSIARVETTLRHNRISLAAIGPVVALGTIFAASVENGQGPLGSFLSADPVLRGLWWGGALAVLAATILVPLLSIRRGKRELQRLHALRNSYRAEGQ